MVSVTAVSSVTECSIMFKDNKVLKVLGWGHFLIDKPIQCSSVSQGGPKSASKTKIPIT